MKYVKGKDVLQGAEVQLHSLSTSLLDEADHSPLATRLSPLATRLHLVLRLRMSGVILLRRQDAITT